MDKSARSRLSDSSRVSEKVMEYYMKYGKDRELEKFMRFRSPCGSHKSSTPSSSLSTSSEDWAKVGNLKCLFHEKEDSSEEIHNVAGPSTNTAHKEHLVPIVVESDYDDERLRENNKPISPITPQSKNEGSTDTKHTQTPESAAKSHKRLEWDSLGDVGYRKSKSTSNISIVERMLLREFFEVSTSAVKNTNSSENDIRLLEQEIADLGTLRKLFSKPKTAMGESSYGTPPLASSTHIEKENKSKPKFKVKPQVQTVGTNTTMSKQKTEKYAQTSIRKPEMTSQEVQVTLTPPGISPLLGSSAEPSSFEYRSRHSTNSSESKSTQSSYKQNKRSAAGEIYANAKEINQNPQQRKALEIKNDNNVEVCERLKNMFITWNNVMKEDKENVSSSSSCSTGSSPPQIDLGIQLIYAIIKAKNIENKQKKRLVRNIVKRITKIANSCELDAIVSKTASLIEGTSDINKKNSTVTQAGEQIDDRTGGECLKSLTSKRMKDQIMSTEESKAIPASKSSETQAHEQETSLTLANIQQPSTKPKKFANKTQSLNVTANISKSTIEPTSSSSKRTSTEKFSSSKILAAVIPQAASAQLPTKPSEKTSTTSTKITTIASSSSSSTEQSPILDISLCVSKTLSGGELISAVISQPETNNGNSTTTSSTTSSSLSFSKNLSTQKNTKVPVTGGNLVVNTDNGAMQEWLNPMTQSEVEFEDKKRTLAPARKERKASGSATTSGKEAGLNWIDSEIERLKNLKQILLNDGTSKSGSSKILPQPLQEISTTSESSDKLYDTVFSDPSQAESRSTAGGVDKVDTISTNKKESEKPRDHCVVKKKAQQQRSKIDTPTGTTGSESVDSFVRQRRQEFLDHYKTQKLNHYDQIMHKYNCGPSTSRASASVPQYQTDCGDHYSVPLRIQQSYYTYPPMQQTYRDPSYYTQTAASSKQVASKKPTNAQHTISSELSVPMGSYNSLSTPTTTHQYDLATTKAHRNKINIGSQTERSLTRSRPIYETRCMSPYHAMVPRSNYVACTCTNMAKTVCIQARPKGVSYTLQFPSKATREKAGCSNAETNSSSNVDYKTLDKKSTPSLQTALKHNHPEFLVQAKKRKSILNRIQKLRLERDRELREIADGNMSLNSLDRKLEELRPPATEKLRLFPTKQMKALTNKRVVKLPEVLAKQELKREERYKRSNRLLRDVFNRRLRERVRKGRLSLNHSYTLI